VAYPLAMAFTLVYAGEHYVFDVLLGWIYAVAVYSAVTALERAWARRRLRARKPALSTDKPLPETASVTT
jgi:membrane-associated phospholipid phosphatase